jgi:carbon-monoxide dehydrogenase medium subunit
VFPAPFEYHRVTSVDDAIALLKQHDGEAKLLAGGHSLLPSMKLRLAMPSHLIDLAGITELSGIRRDGDELVIGALTTHQAIESDQTLRAVCPILPQAASVIGDRQVRNRGTIGGALAHADPAADYPAVVLALDATLVAQGPNGTRQIPVGEFFIDLLTTALQPEEVLTEIRVPVPSAGAKMSYQKLANQASGYATVGVAAVINHGDNGTCQDARIGITGAASHALRATSAESALKGANLDDATVQAAAAHAADGIDFLDDIHAPADYRRHITIGLTRRAIQAAR